MDFRSPRGEQSTRPAATHLHALPPPPKKHPQLNPGAPPGGSTWNLVELRLGLNLETRRTAAVDEALYTRSHARTAYGTVADLLTGAHGQVCLCYTHLVCFNQVGSRYTNPVF